MEGRAALLFAFPRTKRLPEKTAEWTANQRLTGEGSERLSPLGSNGQHDSYSTYPRTSTTGTPAGWLDRRFLRLTHRGRRSGRQYQTLLEVVGTNPVTDEVIVMSGFGHAADWFQNLQAAPAVEVAIGRRRFIPQHRWH